MAQIDVNELHERIIEFIEEYKSISGYIDLVSDNFARLHQHMLKDGGISLSKKISFHFFRKDNPLNNLLTVSKELGALSKTMKEDFVIENKDAPNEKLSTVKSFEVVTGLSYGLKQYPELKIWIEKLLVLNFIHLYKNMNYRGNIALAELKRASNIIKFFEKSDRASTLMPSINLSLANSLQKAEHNNRVYIELGVLIKKAEQSYGRMALETARNFNKRFVVPLIFRYNGSASKVYLNIIFDIVKLRKDVPGCIPEFMHIGELEQYVKSGLIDEYFRPRFGNPNKVYKEVVAFIAKSMENVLAMAQDQLAPFLLYRKSNNIIIVVKSYADGNNFGDVTPVLKYAKRDGKAVKAIRYNADERILRINLNINSLLGDIKAGLTIESDIIHELAHVLEKCQKFSFGTGLSRTYSEGLAVLTECVMRPVKIAGLAPTIEQWLPCTKPIGTIDELRKADKYDLGVAMWLTILLYFLSKQGVIIDINHLYSQIKSGKFSLFKTNLQAIIEQERHRAISYLNHFRRMSDDNFLKFYLKACEKFSLRPAVTPALIIAYQQSFFK